MKQYSFIKKSIALATLFTFTFTNSVAYSDAAQIVSLVQDSRLAYLRTISSMNALHEDGRRVADDYFGRLLGLPALEHFEPRVSGPPSAVDSPQISNQMSLRRREASEAIPRSEIASPPAADRNDGIVRTSWTMDHGPSTVIRSELRQKTQTKSTALQTLMTAAQSGPGSVGMRLLWSRLQERKEEEKKDRPLPTIDEFKDEELEGALSKLKAHYPDLLKLFEEKVKHRAYAEKMTAGETALWEVQGELIFTVDIRYKKLDTKTKSVLFYLHLVSLLTQLFLKESLQKGQSLLLFTLFINGKCFWK